MNANLIGLVISLSAAGSRALRRRTRARPTRNQCLRRGLPIAVMLGLAAVWQLEGRARAAACRFAGMRHDVIMPRLFAGLLANLLLPGSSLVLDGRWLLGLVHLLPALGAVLLLVIALVLGADPLFDRVQLPALLVLAGSVLSAATWHVLLSRSPRLDDACRQRLLAVHQRLVHAYLNGMQEEAQQAARELVRLAPGLIGAWSLLELCAGDGTGDARRSRRRIRALQEERAA